MQIRRSTIQCQLQLAYFVTTDIDMSLHRGGNDKYDNITRGYDTVCVFYVVQ